MKDAYYFSHDSNARNDQRIIKLRRKYGAEGVGIYWMLIEILREQEEYKLGLDDDTIENIAYDLRVEQEKLEDIILHFDLFERDKSDEEYGYFYSKSLKRRMERLDLIKQKRAEAGRMSGKSRQKINTSSASVKQVLNNKAKERIAKESKGYNNLKRIEEFEMSLQEYINQYDSLMLKGFFDYWTEPNRSNTKMKYEMEKTWDLKRRLKRWADNDFGNNKKNGIKKHNFTMPDGKNYLAWCNKCLKSDFYESYNFNPDMIESKCCNDKILPKKPSAVR